jgi:hypothetical protein
LNIDSVPTKELGRYQNRLQIEINAQRDTIEDEIFAGTGKGAKLAHMLLSCLGDDEALSLIRHSLANTLTLSRALDDIAEIEAIRSLERMKYFGQEES